MLAMTWLPYPTTTSPSRTPARCAGLFGSSETTRTPLRRKVVEAHHATGQGDVLPSDPDVAAPDFSLFDQPPSDELRGAHGDGETNPLGWQMTAVLTPMTSPRDVTNGPPELPGLRAIGLNEVVNQAPGLRSQGTSQRTDDPCGHRTLESIRIAQGNDQLTNS